MWLAIQSVYDGTWGSEGVPDEIVDFELMREMGWSWRQLQDTPVYVRRFTWDCIQARTEAQNEANRRSGSSGDGRRHVRR